MVYNWALQKEIDQFELFKLGKTDRQFLSFIDLQNMFKEYRNSDNFLITLPSHSMINAIRLKTKLLIFFLLNYLK